MRPSRTQGMWRSGGALVGLVALAAVVRATTIRAWLMGDDIESIAGSIRLAAARGWFGGAGPGGHVRPLTWWSFAVNQRLGGLDGWGYHLVAVLLHGVVAWLVLGLVRDVLGAAGEPEDRGWRLGVAAGVAFALAPNHAEAVGWVAARADLLLAATTLAAVRLWARSGPALLDRWRLASVGAFCLALASKETAIVVPALLVAWDMLLGARPDGEAGEGLGVRARRAVGRVALHLVALGGYLALYAVVNRSLFSDARDEASAGGALGSVRRTAAILVRSVLPGVDARTWAVGALVGLAVVVVALLLGWRPAREHLATVRRPLAFLLVATVLCAAPLARFGVSLTSAAGERMAYLPSCFAIPAVVMVTWALLAPLPRPARRAIAVAVLLLLVGATLVADGTYVRGGRTSRRLVASTARFDPERGAVVLVAPDTVGGAWVQRNGMGPALELVHGWGSDVRYAEVVPVHLRRGDEHVRRIAGPCRGCTTFVLPPGSRAMPVGSVPGEAGAIPGLDVVVRSGRRITIRVGPGVDRSTLWYVDRGRLVRAFPDR
ncbi:MAG: hypothetical protein U0P45_01520 [Acidimicrobiales bacterium]